MIQFLRETWRALFAANPRPGEVYVFDDSDPFGEHLAKVTDYRDGWVQYEYVGGLGNKHSKHRYWFLVCYRRQQGVIARG
jgi:hypothetical protein